MTRKVYRTASEDASTTLYLHQSKFLLHFLLNKDCRYINIPISAKQAKKEQYFDEAVHIAHIYNVHNLLQQDSDKDIPFDAKYLLPYEIPFLIQFKRLLNFVDQKINNMESSDNNIFDCLTQGSSLGVFLGFCTHFKAILGGRG